MKKYAPLMLSCIQSLAISAITLVHLLYLLAHPSLGQFAILLFSMAVTAASWIVSFVWTFQFLKDNGYWRKWQRWTRKPFPR